MSLKPAILLISAGVLCACNQTTKTQKQADSLTYKNPAVKSTQLLIEDFDTFFKRFENDEATYLLRVKFPLKIIYKTDGADADKVDSVKVIERKDWHFSRTKTKGLIVKKIYNSPNEMHVLYQVEDTGIHTVYFFKRKGESWQLDHIEDSSD
ncbi:hypothetical protein HQ865_23180 [Mucilaginibacter mali]|uniref:DUF4348 domain-containing protein n=1 Tax=Mucilaginibacter mali TaxID=2740462 RepID=A0A7D4UP22_9SPHI|nr:hypothetical protein [Mucilaginibacter mali]QKJ32541.1 hypothetical protein HQ865_23180 [Mucilaginibacter mali]